MTIRVGVFGAGGRMGSTVCAAVNADPETTLVAAIDPSHAGSDLQTVAKTTDVPALEVLAGPDGLADALDVMVDFTYLEAARSNLAWAAESGVHAVVGSTGFTDGDRARFADIFTSSNCLIAPNFAIGAVLMMRFAELAAPWFETGEVVEYHHMNKVDAPSGTAMLTAERMAAASSDWAEDPTKNHVVEGARGGRAGGIPVHSIRMSGMVAHQEVLLGTQGETLTIRHDSYDRTSFMPGVLLGVKKVGDHDGLTIGLDSLLGL